MVILGGWVFFYKRGTPVSLGKVVSGGKPRGAVDTQRGVGTFGARPGHLIITMIKWIRTSRLPIKNFLSVGTEHSKRDSPPHKTTSSEFIQKVIGFIQKVIGFAKKGSFPYRAGVILAAARHHRAWRPDLGVKGFGFRVWGLGFSV